MEPRDERPLRWLRRIALGLARKALPQSELGKACTYLLNNWDVLVAHQNHSFTRIDNNLVENGTPNSEFPALLRVSDNSEFALGECGSAECLGALWGVESSGLCDRLKEGEQPRGLVPPDAIRSFGLGESTEALSLHLEIRLDVSVRRHRTGVT
ncbi:MAG: transposase [Gemmatimonadaceae bacterium]|nr:transposase [Gemmatimonadaceae bacterium]